MLYSFLLHVYCPLSIAGNEYPLCSSYLVKLSRPVDVGLRGLGLYKVTQVPPGATKRSESMDQVDAAIFGGCGSASSTCCIVCGTWKFHGIREMKDYSHHILSDPSHRFTSFATLVVS